MPNYTPELKYIDNPKECHDSAEEFLAEFREHVYPAYASYGLTFYEAVALWKQNCIFNSITHLTDLIQKNKEDWE